MTAAAALCGRGIMRAIPDENAAAALSRRGDYARDSR